MPKFFPDENTFGNVYTSNYLLPSKQTEKALKSKLFCFIFSAVQKFPSGIFRSFVLFILMVHVHFAHTHTHFHWRYVALELENFSPVCASNPILIYGSKNQIARSIANTHRKKTKAKTVFECSFEVHEYNKVYLNANGGSANSPRHHHYFGAAHTKKSALYQQWQRVHIDGEKNGERITKKQSRLKRQIAKSENNKILRSG